MADTMSKDFPRWWYFGAIITNVWVPNLCDIFGETRSLEDLSKGKKARKEMEEDEKLEKRMAEPARYGDVWDFYFYDIFGRQCFSFEERYHQERRNKLKPQLKNIW